MEPGGSKGIKPKRKKGRGLWTGSVFFTCLKAAIPADTRRGTGCAPGGRTI